MYRPGKLHRQVPKLLGGACTTHALLDLAWRQSGVGTTNKVHVERYFDGEVKLDVPAMDEGGAYLYITVEGSHDTQRWADREKFSIITAPGYYRLPVTNLGAYLRVAYQIEGSIQFGIEFVGKCLQVGGAPREYVR
jgi:hypothetical protein